MASKEVIIPPLRPEHIGLLPGGPDKVVKAEEKKTIVKLPSEEKAAKLTAAVKDLLPFAQALLENKT